MLENAIRKVFLQFLKSGATTVWECWGRDWADLSNSRLRPDCMTMLVGIVRFFYDDIACIRGPDFMGSRSLGTGYKQIIIQPLEKQELQILLD